MDFDATMQALNMSYAKVLNETWKTFNIVSTDTKCVVPIPKSVVQIPESSFYVKRASTDLKTFIIPSLNYKLNEKEYENKFGNYKNCLYPFDQAIFENILKETN